MSLTALVVKRPSLVLVLIALATLAGLLAAPKLARQQYPNVDLPTIQVSVSDPGASTGQMRDAIVRPLEDQIAGAPQLDHLTTTIEQGQATIAAVFSLGSDKNADLAQVQNRVQIAQPTLPSDVTPPVVAAFDPTQGAVISLVAVAPSLSLQQLSARLTASIVPALTQLPSVGGVSLSGNVVPSYQVEVDPNALVASGYTLGDVVNTISGNNVRAPGGIVYGTDRETGLTVRGDVRSPQSVADLALPPLAAPASQGNPWHSAASIVPIRAIADVRDAYEPRRVYAFSRGAPTISLDVTKATGASDIATSSEVLAALPRLAAQFPDVQLRVLAVESRYTREQVTSAIRSLIEAIILASLAMLVFLRSWRHAIVVLIAIPTSLCVTLAFMAITGMTLDTVSLGAMTLAIGILVDDSTVVLENITRRFAQGEDAETAAVRGRMEIGMAAVALTLVDVVVFVPIAFLPGIIGRFLQEFGAVVVVATLTSLAVGFIVTPSLAARWSLLSRWRPPRFIDAFDSGFERVRAFYAERILPAALGHPTLIVATAVLSLVFAIALIPTGIVGFTFLPPDDRGAFFVQVTYPAGTPLDQTAAGMLKLERAVDGIADLDSETTIAGGYQASFGGIVNEGSVGQIHVFLRDHRHQSTAEWRRFIEREGARLLPGAKTIVIPAAGLGGGPSQDVDVIVRAVHSDAEAAAAALARALEQTPGTYAVTTLAQRLAPQLDVGFDRRRASVLGVSIGTASQAVHAAFGGALATQFSDELGTHDVNVIYPLADQHDLAPVEAIAVRTSGGAIVHVGDVATLQNVPQAPVLTRQDRTTVVHVAANVLPGVALSNVERAFAARQAALHLPSDVVVSPSANGSEQNLKDLRTGIAAALVVSLLLIYLLLAALYDGFVTPFVVMLAVPVAAVGALGALAATNETLNLFSLIGTILLLGLVIKNGVLLVDFANTRVRAGEPARAAVVESATLRFRPIVMTTSVMVVSMLPIALALEPGSAVRRSLGIVVIGGLTSSLLLTLVLVPVIFVAIASRRPSIVSAGTPGSEAGGTSGVTVPSPALPQ
jgi:HAE1 family hydrophobic/amphiphilic exporter-1